MFQRKRLYVTKKGEKIKNFFTPKYITLKLKDYFF